ncbi:capsular polysaccharide biosynthesis protein [Shimia ponticola]|uniref:capsular polysaccharide biosynthesis protein n=1 Tax=Shimia ponticola TaxID=2582893 RepID=UPI002107EEB8|nr:capsular polysaccharide biosynthesis protein [Shimia ponticola]
MERQSLFVFNGGFLTQRRVRRILDLAGFDIRLGKPSENQAIGIWGNSPTAHRGTRVAETTGSPVIRVEDALLRSVHPGRNGDPACGLLIDRKGVHFDPSKPSHIETLLATHPLDDSALLRRARHGIEAMTYWHLSKYNAFAPHLEPPAPGYVVVVDQTHGDASVTASGADRGTFQEMLVHAQTEHPDARILIKTHPETSAGHRSGYYTDADTSERVQLFSDPISPWRLLEGARGVYTVSSGLGFEAIFAGHKPRVFGQPFYAGWGLTDDENPHPRRARTLTRAQLFAAAMILYPTWYDPYRDRLCELEDVIANLAAQARAWREDCDGWVATGMRLWKRRPLTQFFGSVKAPVFVDDPAKAGDRATALDRPTMVWAGKASPDTDAARIEDGFLRSKGLGADLTPPLSLVIDDLGIYYDPTRESRLEHLIADAATLPDAALERAAALKERLIKGGLSKYNLGGAQRDMPEGHRILVPGQVEDDASIRLGTADISTNLALLKTTRQHNPDALIIYKPHPDVEAGLRPGQVSPEDAHGFADVIADHADPIALLSEVQEVWTMTSLLGFEALLRGIPTTCLGTPFYCGWGLTRDLGRVPARRRARPTLDGLIHAALIDYPRYYDPLTKQAAPVEVVVDRLLSGHIPRSGLALRLLAKAQGVLASQAHLWR